MTPTLLPEGVRKPVNLSFGAVGVKDAFTSQLLVRGDLVFGAGAAIKTDPTAAVSLSGNTVAVFGSIFAPGGSITIKGASDSNGIFPELGGQLALVTVRLAPGSVLSTAGTTLLTPDPRGYRTGVVLPGGNITISGNIVAETGALLDVSGATDVLDMQPGFAGLSIGLDAMSATPNASLGGSLLVPMRVDSNGGSITLAGGQELFTNATLVGRAGGPSASGGSLTISSGRFYPVGSNLPSPTDITLEVTQSGPTFPSGNIRIGQPVLEKMETSFRLLAISRRTVSARAVSIRSPCKER